MGQRFFTLVERPCLLERQGESSKKHMCYGRHPLTCLKPAVCITDSLCSTVYLLLLEEKSLRQEALNCIRIITNKK